MRKFFSNDKRGAAFVMTMIMMVVALAAIASLYQTIETRQKDIRLLIATEGQAKNIAEAAHIDVLNWFRVMATVRQDRFFPLQDFSDPDEIFDETDDPVIGLVREHVLSENPLLIGRYEVRRQFYNPDFPEDPHKEDLGLGEGQVAGEYLEIDTKSGVKRITSQRLNDNEVYEIVSFGFIFSPKNRATYNPKNFYQSDPNISFTDTNGNSRNLPLVNRYNLDEIEMFAQAKVRSEILQLQVSLPFPAAVCYRGSLQVRERGVIQTLETDNSVTTARRPGSNSPQLQNGGTLDPSNNSFNIVVQGANGEYDDSIVNVFGLPDEEILSTSPDTILFSSVEEMEASNLQSSKINFLGNPSDNNLPTFTIPTGSNLRASNAILYVKGNLIVEPGSNFSFTGIIYVVGRVVFDTTSFITGGVIIQNRNNTNINQFNQTSLINGNFDASTVIYQASVIGGLQITLGQYTFFQPPHFLEKDSGVATFVGN